ncbi:MAG: potassium-transporting ATPase subunit C, partial [Aeromonas sp.]|nr:potassium-transporting ATPase subunit C [Aeromonas sp.]MBP9570042.1 potassium-transporting ATPase subunit C [Aeromonadaceae bacterium]
MLTLLRPALLLWCGFTLLLGLVYPLSMTGLAQLLFPAQANGSLVYHNGQVVGSQLIGQSFTAPNYFWGRLSAVSYDGASSGGTNFGPLNPALLKQV